MNAVRLGGEIIAAQKELDTAINKIETHKLSLINAQKRINRLEREVVELREQRDKAYDEMDDIKMLEVEVIELREYKLAHEPAPDSFVLPDGEAW